LKREIGVPIVLVRRRTIHGARETLRVEDAARAASMLMPKI